MASLEELEKKVKELQKKLKEESEKTSAVEKEVHELSKEVATLKGEGNNSSVSPKSESTPSPKVEKLETINNNGTVKKADIPSKKEESDDSSSEEGADSSNEKTTAASPKTSDSVEPENKILKTGWLEKKGAIRHNWLKRWFELDSANKYLSYYDNKVDSQTKGTQAKGVVPLINATCFAHVEKKGVTKPLFFQH